MVSCLTRLSCSEVLWGGGALQTSVPGLCGERSATLGLPPAPSTLLRLQVALQGAGPGLRALPRSKPLRSRFSGTPQRGRLGWACALCLPGSEQLRRPGARPAPSPRVGDASCHLPVPAGQFPGRRVSELISGCDPPGGCQPS